MLKKRSDTYEIQSWWTQLLRNPRYNFISKSLVTNVNALVFENDPRKERLLLDNIDFSASQSIHSIRLIKNLKMNNRDSLIYTQ